METKYTVCILLWIAIHSVTCVDPTEPTPVTSPTTNSNDVTPSPDNVKPPPDGVEPLPDDVTPSPNDVTPSPDDVTPSPGDVPLVPIRPGVTSSPVTSAPVVTQKTTAAIVIHPPESPPLAQYVIILVTSVVVVLVLVVIVIVAVVCIMRGRSGRPSHSTSKSEPVLRRKIPRGISIDNPMFRPDPANDPYAGYLDINMDTVQAASGLESFYNTKITRDDSWSADLRGETVQESRAKAEKALKDMETELSRPRTESCSTDRLGEEGVENDISGVLVLDGMGDVRSRTSTFQ